jgi:hypothetical protein
MHTRANAGIPTSQANPVLDLTAGPRTLPTADSGIFMTFKSLPARNGLAFVGATPQGALLNTSEPIFAGNATVYIIDTAMQLSKQLNLYANPKAGMPYDSLSEALSGIQPSVSASHSVLHPHHHRSTAGSAPYVMRLVIES